MALILIIASIAGILGVIGVTVATRINRRESRATQLDTPVPQARELEPSLPAAPEPVTSAQVAQELSALITDPIQLNILGESIKDRAQLQRVHATSLHALINGKELPEQIGRYAGNNNPYPVYVIFLAQSLMASSDCPKHPAFKAYAPAMRCFTPEIYNTLARSAESVLRMRHNNDYHSDSRVFSISPGASGIIQVLNQYQTVYNYTLQDDELYFWRELVKKQIALLVSTNASISPKVGGGLQDWLALLSSIEQRIAHQERPH